MSVSLIDGHIDNDVPRMTDEQIIKGWELLEKHGGTPTNFLVDETLDLINRQKAEIESNKAKIKISAECIARQDKEIERLNSIRSRLIYDSGTLTKIPDELYQKIKVEAVKEFAARLRYVSKPTQSGYFSNRLVTVRDIDDLEEEMVGDS